MLTQKQERFVDELIVCGCGAEAARRAGYPARSARQVGFENLTKPDIKAAIAAKRSAVAREIELHREDIIAGIFNGIAIARANGDAGNVIKGWVSISVMTGLDQPEAAATPIISAAGKRLLSKLQAMSTEQLLAISEGRAV